MIGMSKQVGTIAASLMNTSLNQKTLDDSLERNNSAKSEFLREFQGTNAAEVFQRDFSRSSYRRLMNDVTSDIHPFAPIQKVEDDSSDGQVTQDSNDTSDDTAGQGSETSFHSLPPTMTSLKSDVMSATASDILTTSANNEALSSQTSNPYVRSSDGHFFIPVHQLNASRLVTIPQNLMMTQSGINNTTTHMVEEASRKRQLRLLKNKEAAKECRRKKKEYVKCLENRVAVLENQNKTLIEELKSLKELYCQKDVQS